MKRGSKYKELFDKAFKEMPSTFTSTDFSRAIKENGITADIIKRGSSAQYLHNYCEKVPGRSVWIKNNGRTKQKPEEPMVDITVTPSPATKTDEECIQQLKSKGYIIWKPSNYIEV